MRMIGVSLNVVNSDDRKWKINWLLLADDGDSEKFCHLMEEFGQVCRRNLRVDRMLVVEG